MIADFVLTWEAKKNELAEQYRREHPDSYEGIFEDVVRLLGSCDDYEVPDADRITVINHGSYQGTIVFVVGAKGYQPDTHWACSVSYGSCSACDTFQHLRYSCGPEDWDDETPTKEQASGYLSLALHMVQSLVEIT